MADRMRFRLGFFFYNFKAITRWRREGRFTSVGFLSCARPGGAKMKKDILVEDHPPLEGEMLTLVVLPLAVAVLAGVTLTIFLW